MNHERIDSQNVVERYVLGRLDETEQVRFEDHYADCPRCLEAVELAQELRAGFLADADAARQAVVESTPEAEVVAFEQPESPPRKRASGSWGGVLRWAAVVALALLPSWWLVERNQALQRQLVRLEKPVAVTPDAMLELHRDSAGPAALVRPEAGDPWIHLAIDLGDLGETPTVAAALAAEGGPLLWADETLPAPASGPLTLSFPRRLLPAGRYRLEVSLRSGDRVEPVGSFRLEIADAP